LKLIIRLIVNAVAIYVAILILQPSGDITMEITSWLNFLWLALIFSVINVTIKPILKVVGCPILILTLGLGTLLINTFLFWLLSLASKALNLGFVVTNFWGAFFGSLIVSVIAMVLNRILRD
jgi:putative membrane protein